MILEALALLVAAPMPLFAGPAKMVIMNSQSVTVTDYPNLARCREARRTLVEIINKGEPTAGGGSAVRLGISIYCIPG